MKKRIHIFGASGSGTTSIGKAVCNKLGYKHFDSDNYLWLPTEEPFTVIRSSDEYINLMGKDLSANDMSIQKNFLIIVPDMIQEQVAEV